MTPAQYNEYQRQAESIDRHEKWKQQFESKETAFKHLINNLLAADAESNGDNVYLTISKTDLAKCFEIENLNFYINK